MRRLNVSVNRRWMRGAGLLAVAALIVGAAAEPATRPEATRTKKPPSGFAKAAIITIEGEINDVMADSIERRVQEARDQDIRLIIFEMDTPGGSVASALDICSTIKDLSREVHTVAWINPHAFSAGAMISLACKEIVVSPNARIGDCQPIMVGPQGVQAIPDDVKAKMKAPVLTEFRDSAKKRGYDPLLCLAMIEPQREVFWVERIGPDGKVLERRFVDRAERDRLFGLTGEEATEAPETRTKETRTTKTVQGQEVEQTEREIVAQARGIDEQVRSKTDWETVRKVDNFPVDKNPIVAADELLTMTQDEAIAYGFARAKVADWQGLVDLYDVKGDVQEMTFTWSEQLVNWLTNPIVRGILMTLVLLGAYVEFNTPGVGIAGLVALICLVIFLGAPYLTGLANAWEIILVVLGLVFIGLEIFVIPGFGIAGIAGIVLVLAGLVATFVPEEPGIPFTLPRFDTTWRGAKIGLMVMASAMTGSFIGAMILSRYLQKVPYVGRLVAPNPTAEDISTAEAYPRSAFLGEVGKSVGPLRPAGKADFGGCLVDVVAQSNFIEAGAPVEVIERRGNRIVVRKLEDA